MNLDNLPGAELILPGLDDLTNGNPRTIGALLITIASTRLRTAGLEFPTDVQVTEPELTLYTQLQQQREDAYTYYNALLDSLNSFCNALEMKQFQSSRSHFILLEGQTDKSERVTLPDLKERGF